jgi:hypothetical protein
LPPPWTVEAGVLADTHGDQLPFCCATVRPDFNLYSATVIAAVTMVPFAVRLDLPIVQADFPNEIVMIDDPELFSVCELENFPLR